MNNFKNEFQQIYNKHHLVGMNVAIFNRNNNGQVASFGYQSLELSKPLNENTIFRIASVSKVIVAIGVMMLVDQGLVDIDEDISKYLGYKIRNPHYPDTPITIKMLMTQSSSISDGADEYLGYDGVNGPKEFVSLENLLTNPNYPYYLDRTFTLNKPGHVFEYSNFGCGILACIIESLTGEYFTDYIRKELLLPMEMDASFRIDDIKNIQNVASLYEYNGSNFVLTKDLNRFLEAKFPRYELGNNFRGPAGGLFISLKDLVKIGIMFLNNGIYNNKVFLKSETVELMKKTHFVINNNDSYYKMKGLQMIILDEFNEILYGHFGSAYGLQSFMLFNNKNVFLFACNGGEYKTENHITTIQRDVIVNMLKYKNEYDT